MSSSLSFRAQPARGPKGGVGFRGPKGGVGFRGPKGGVGF
jgi:hypothetical protein